ncbi:MAG TPA: enoyl-CoA hydratase-related protein [Candidatus Dormibacteraeota bacterium]|nr:enoyl-CoA hydratase-related protein [Candidatus Dormibacteraeota bacterium]
MAVEVEQHVKLDTEGAVAWIRLNRPDKLNAIGSVMRKQLSDAIKQAERDDAVRVIVLAGSGRAFSAGGDIAEMDQGMDSRTPEDLGRVLRDEYGAMFIRLRTMSKPVIAAMNGPAFGIGASLALACDIRVGVPEASLTEAFINIGLVMEGGASFLLPRLAGLGVAYEMFFTGQPLPAADAHRLGLINRIVPADRLESEVNELAQHIASQPRQALAGAKKAVNRALTSTYEAAVEFESYLQEAQAASGEFAEGVRKFQASRAKK